MLDYQFNDLEDSEIDGEIDCLVLISHWSDVFIVSIEQFLSQYSFGSFFPTPCSCWRINHNVMTEFSISKQMGERFGNSLKFLDTWILFGHYSSFEKKSTPVFWNSTAHHFGTKNGSKWYQLKTKNILGVLYLPWTKMNASIEEMRRIRPVAAIIVEQHCTSIDHRVILYHIC